MKNTKTSCANVVQGISNKNANQLIFKRLAFYHVLEAGLEPAQPQWPKDFKSFVSTIPPFEHPFKERAENETRTRDPNLGKVMLYQLSYFRRFPENGCKDK